MYDLVKDDRTILNYDEICEKYPGSFTWLEYTALRSAIPRSWLVHIVTHDVPQTTVYGKITSYDKPVRHFNCLCLVIKDQVAKQRSKLSKHVAFTMGCQNNKSYNLNKPSAKIIFSQDVDHNQESTLCADELCKYVVWAFAVIK